MSGDKDTSFDADKEFIKRNKAALIAEGYRIIDRISAGLEPIESNVFIKLGFQETRHTTKRPAAINAEEMARMNYLASIVCVMWAIDDKSNKVGEAFERGSWRIKNDMLFKFLHGYYDVANPTKLPSIVPSKGLFIAKNNMIYPRNPEDKLSSHYKMEHNQHGIDVRFSPDDNCSFILPHGWSHILFGLLNIDRIAPNTFLKLEKFGMGDLQQVLRHGLEFMDSEPITSAARREKDLPQGYAEAYKTFCKAANLEAKYSTIRDIHSQASDYMWDNTAEAKPKAVTDTYNNMQRILWEAIGDRINNVNSRVGNEVELDLKEPVWRAVEDYTDEGEDAAADEEAYYQQQNPPPPPVPNEIKSYIACLKGLTDWKCYLPALILMADHREMLDLDTEFLSKEIVGDDGEIATVAELLYETDNARKALYKILEYAKQVIPPTINIPSNITKTSFLGWRTQQSGFTFYFLARDGKSKKDHASLYNAVTQGSLAEVKSELASATSFYDNETMKSDTALIQAARLGKFIMFDLIITTYNEQCENSWLFTSRSLRGIREANPENIGTAFNFLVDNIQSKPSEIDSICKSIDTFLRCLQKHPPGVNSFGLSGKTFDGIIGVKDAFGLTPIERIAMSGNTKVLETLIAINFLEMFGISTKEQAEKLLRLVPASSRDFANNFCKFVNDKNPSFKLEANSYLSRAKGSIKF